MVCYRLTHFRLIKLREAIREGDIEAVKRHLAAGADVNAKDERGRTPLNWAIRLRKTEIAALFRKHGGKTGEELGVSYLTTDSILRKDDKTGEELKAEGK